MKLINNVITAVLDPNLYFSRFSFFESDKQAIDIKFRVRRPSFDCLAKKRRDGTSSSEVKVQHKISSL